MWYAGHLDAHAAVARPTARHTYFAPQMSARMARSAGLMSIATMVSRLLGVVRESVLAALFGARGGPEMDAFNVAFRVPNLLRDLFAEGAMSAAFIPTFTATLTKQGREQAWRLGNLVINALLVGTGVVVVIGIIFAGPLTHALVSSGEFMGVPGKMELTTQLTRLMLPFLTTIAVAVAMMGMLNSLRRFFIPALSPAMFNVATIVCAVVLVPVMPWFGLPRIAGVAIGTVLGGLGQILLQWPVLHREGFRYRPILDFRDPDLRQILRLMGPGTIGLAAVQINVFVNTILATGQPQGSVSFLNYAFRLMYLPIGMFGVAIATAAIPEIARHAALSDRPAIRGTVGHALRLMLMLNVPATLGLIALAHPIIAFLLERGRFTPEDTTATAAALMCYAPGLIGYSAVKIASPTFYSLKDSRTPVIVSVVTVLVNLGLNVTLVRVLGFRGLALGTAAAAIFNAGLLLWLLRGRLDGIEGRRTTTAFLKILMASTVMGGVAWWTDRALHSALPNGVLVHAGIDIYLLVRLITSIGVSLVGLVLAARLLRVDELQQATALVRRRLTRPRDQAASGKAPE